jgi:hypothetical protein
MTTATTPTMNDIVTRALKRLRVINSRETVEAIAATDGLERLNDMMHALKAAGVEIDHDTLEATDDFPLDEEFVQGTAALLAVALADDHGAEVSDGTARDAQQCWEGLQAEFVAKPDPATVDLALRRTGRNFY